MTDDEKDGHVLRFILDMIDQKDRTDERQMAMVQSIAVAFIAGQQIGKPRDDDAAIDRFAIDLRERMRTIRETQEAKAQATNRTVN